jgi:hypothetical protein
MVTLAAAIAIAMAGCGKSKKELAVAAEKEQTIFLQLQRQQAEKERLDAETAKQAERQTSAARAQERDQADAQLVLKLKTKVVSGLKDPDSAQFQSIQLNSARSALCGQVNAKNSYGGYVGFRRFVSSEETAAIEGEKKSDRAEDLLSRVAYLSQAGKVGCPTGEP